MPEGTVAYVLKGFPRLTETFIASEIFRLEQAGLDLRLFATKQDETWRHPVVDRIRATPEYLPRTTSLSRAQPLGRWLALNGPAFGSALRRVTRRQPIRLARAAGAAFAQSLRARRHPWSRPRGVYLKELLQAVALADRLLDTPDVRHLHAHFAHGATTVAWLASLLTGLPFSFTAHATDIYRESVNPAGLLGRKLRAARFAVTCTEANRAFLQARAGKTPVHCIYHGLGVDFANLLDQAPARPSVAETGCLKILSVGRLVPKKGFLTLVEACAILRQRGVRFEVSIVGETGEDDAAGAGNGPALPGSPAAKRQHAQHVRERIAELGLERQIRLAGPMSQAALFDAYRQSDVVCLACRIVDDGDRDGIPNVLAEAMACGVPVVTTAISGLPELVTDGVNGLLVPPDRPDAVADALSRLRDEPTLAGALGRAAQSTVRERFDGDAGARRLKQLFDLGVRA